jgi:hypothetical protein
MITYPKIPSVPERVAAPNPNWCNFRFIGRRRGGSLFPRGLLRWVTSKETRAPVVTETLHCRLLALTRGDFNSVARTTRQFGRPITSFDQSVSVVAWHEAISFQAGDWSWAEGIPATPIKVRIAVFDIGALTPNVGVYGIISGFSSLSNAARNYIVKPFIDNQVSLQIDLGAIIADSALQHSAIVGYSYNADGIFHTVSNIDPARTSIQKSPEPPPSSTFQSVRLQASSALADVDRYMDLTLSAEPGDPDYAIEDSRAVFAKISQYVRVLRT